MKKRVRRQAPEVREPQGLLDVEGAAKRTGWSPKTIRNKVLRREIEFVKLGRSVKFRPEAIEQLIQESIVPPLAEAR